MKKPEFDFQWVTDGKEYSRKLNRESFYAIFNGLAIGYGGSLDNNEISKKMVSIIPEIDTITINQDINNTQDVPIIIFEIGSDVEVLKIKRNHKIVWSVLNGFCTE